MTDRQTISCPPRPDTHLGQCGGDETQSQARLVAGELHDIEQRMARAIERLEHITDASITRIKLREMRLTVDGASKAWRRRAGL